LIVPLSALGATVLDKDIILIELNKRKSTREKRRNGRGTVAEDGCGREMHDLVVSATTIWSSLIGWTTSTSPISMLLRTLRAISTTSPSVMAYNAAPSIACIGIIGKHASPIPPQVCGVS
jgi:hypothetical protein